MGRASLRIGITGDDKLDDLSHALERANLEIPVDLKNTIRQSAGTLGDRAALRVMLEPVHGAKHTGLRAKVARGVGLRELNNGYRVTTSMPNPNEAAIPRGMDQQGWRHPVFGNTGNWVREGLSDFSWFLDTMQEGASLVADNLHDTLEDAAERVVNSVRT